MKQETNVKCRKAQAFLPVWAIAFLVTFGGLRLVTIHAADPAEGEKGYEYAAGEVTLPFSYSAQVSSAPRPRGLDFPREPNPDNSQIFVKMEGELWQFRNHWITGGGTVSRYKGPDIDHMVQVEEGKYPDGMSMCWFLGGMWYDEAGRKLYAPLHIEQEGIHRSHPVARWSSRKIALATSMDQGKTWSYEGDIVTPETYYYNHEVYKFSGSCYGNGVADFGFYVDVRGGYFYLFPDEAWFLKEDMGARWSVRAARCAIGDKMAPGKWKYFYRGTWDEPALGGKSSIVVPSHLWGVIYSTYLEKYLCMFPSCCDPPVGDNVDGVYIGVCSDLSKQDWTWGYCPQAMFGFMNVMNAHGTELTTCGQTLRYYSYFSQNTFQRLDLTLGHGQTVTTDLAPRFLFEAHPESSDPLLSRRTKIIGSASSEMAYSGPWIDHRDRAAYAGRSKECASAGASVEFSFTGAEVYWRAVRSPASGKADVYLDGAWRKTVDCYSPRSTTFEVFTYIKTGIDPTQAHTLKLVVRGDKHPQSKGTAIRHIAFEYTAESYLASAGFCSLMGKNNWSYQQGNGPDDRDMRFIPNDSAFQNYWLGEGNCRIGNNYQVPDAQGVVRKWVAPHGGTVRIEGEAALDQAGGDGVYASLFRNASELWPAKLITHGQPASHDLTVEVQQGDAISFRTARKAVAGSNAHADFDKVTWDPVITYTRGLAPVWKPNSPSAQNIALGKYARSKTLVCTYRPFDAVDGSMGTAFVIPPNDKLSSGDDWLMLDLEKRCRIDRYIVHSQPQNPEWRPAQLALQKSDDGFSWAEVDLVSPNAREKTDRVVPAFCARYVRLYLPLGKPFAIHEFELFYTEGKSRLTPP